MKNVNGKGRNVNSEAEKCNCLFGWFLVEVSGLINLIVYQKIYSALRKLRGQKLPFFFSCGKVHIDLLEIEFNVFIGGVGYAEIV